MSQNSAVLPEEEDGEDEPSCSESETHLSQRPAAPHMEEASYCPQLGQVPTAAGTEPATLNPFWQVSSQSERGLNLCSPAELRLLIEPQEHPLEKQHADLTLAPSPALHGASESIYVEHRGWVGGVRS